MNNVVPIESARGYKGRLEAAKHIDVAVPLSLQRVEAQDNLTDVLFYLIHELIAILTQDSKVNNEELLDRVLHFIDVETLRKGIPLADLVVFHNNYPIPSRYLCYLVRRAIVM